jgi:hypothetical protein
MRERELRRNAWCNQPWLVLVVVPVAVVVTGTREPTNHADVSGAAGAPQCRRELSEASRFSAVRLHPKYLCLAAGNILMLLTSPKARICQLRRIPAYCFQCMTDTGTTRMCSSEQR